MTTHATTASPALEPDTELGAQITCLYDMDIPRPDNFNEAYLYEGTFCLRPYLSQR